MSHLEEKHFVNRQDYLQAKADLIQKGLYGGLPCEDLIMKGGEGSKGGKVIGHTKSGKPIYENADHSSHKNFTREDHLNAGAFHFKAAQKIMGKERYEDIKDKEKKSKIDYHETQSSEHFGLVDKEEDSKGAVGKDTMKNSPANSKEDEAWNKFKDNTRKHFEGGDKEVEKAEGDVNDGTFDKAESSEYNAKIKKVMDEFKAGTLKSSAGEKVTDRDQAIAIALSEAKDLKKAITAAAGEGVTQKESVEHNPKDMQNPKSSDLKKAYEALGLGDLIKEDVK